MNEKRLAVASLVAAVLIAPGCLGSLGGSQSDLQVIDIDGDWTESGTLEIQATVRNAGSAEGTGTVVVRASIDGGETYTEGREVTVPPGGTETVAVAFEPPADVVGSGFSTNAWME